MTNPEISLAVSAACFSFVIGFFAGYGLRAYISYLHRRPKDWSNGSTVKTSRKARK
jgi:hypothetical protein